MHLIIGVKMTIILWQGQGESTKEAVCLQQAESWLGERLTSYFNIPELQRNNFNPIINAQSAALGTIEMDVVHNGAIANETQYIVSSLPAEQHLEPLGCCGPYKSFNTIIVLKHFLNIRPTIYQPVAYNNTHIEFAIGERIFPFSYFHHSIHIEPLQSGNDRSHKGKVAWTNKL